MHKTIFIVDDNPLVLALVRQALETQPGFEVCGQAGNGRDAVEKAPKLNPDLIVLDLSMPLMGGLEAAHALRGLMPNVPILLFTIYKMRLSEAEVRASGASAVAYKGDGIAGLIKEAKTLLHC